MSSAGHRRSVSCSGVGAVSTSISTICFASSSGLPDAVVARVSVHPDPRSTGTRLFVWVYSLPSIKRLHDRDKSGWWMVLFFSLPGLSTVGRPAWRPVLAMSSLMLLGWPPSCFVIWGFVEMYCLRGTRSPTGSGPIRWQPIDTRPRWEQQSELEFCAAQGWPTAGVAMLSREHDRRPLASPSPATCCAAPRSPRPMPARSACSKTS